jgi:hypothetical protein
LHKIILLEKIRNFLNNQKKIVHKWLKVGNYLKTCLFLGKVGLSEKVEISYEIMKNSSNSSKKYRTMYLKKILQNEAVFKAFFNIFSS